MNIEELAFKDRRELANLNVIDLLDIIELLQKDRKQWIYQFTNTFNESIKIDETALSLYKENQELKKQLEDENEKIILLQASEPMLNYKKALEETQQKEFIEWLEAMNIMYKNEYKDIDTAEHYNCVLQKYKSIIGDDK